MDYTQVLLRPLISEKASMAKEQSNQVCFYVHPEANKIEVKKAVERAFGVTVRSVNIVRKRPVNRMRSGRVVGRQSGYKKAFVKLTEGDKIEFFEGV
ncbi:MAG: 50S ribosomal protein L23 [Desulfovibrionaceae bacterium]|nr:50S ribosomal protein L23 [Desulfovibrionaceae bacterium]